MNNAILASHGTDNIVGAGLISRLVEAVALAIPETAVFETFVDVQQPQIGEVLAGAVEANPAGHFSVVPLLLSTGYHVRQDITDAVLDVEAAAENSGHRSPEIVVTPALGPSLPVIDLLYQRLREVGWLPDDIVVLAVAGSSDEAAVEECRLVHLILKEAIQEQHPNAQVELAFLSAVEPKLKDLVPKLKFQNPRKRVVVANYLLAPGFFNDLANRAGAHLVAQPLLADGQTIPEQLVEIVVRRITEAASDEGTLGCTKAAGAAFSCALGCSAPCR
jgi:sirohydrochlorin ferrochelatase